MQRGPAARRRLAAVGGGSALPLDIAPGAAAAYSLRRLSAAYGGPAVDLRRASDNAVQSFSFAGNDLDTAALAAFLNATTGFVSKWYDQSGNGNHAVQATAANQPQLVTGIAALNGRPGILFGDNAAFSLTVPQSLSTANLWAAGGFLSITANITGNSSAGDRIFDKSLTLLRFQTTSTFLLFSISASGGNGSWNTSSGIGLGAHQFDLQYSAANLANVPVFTVDGTTKGQGAPTQPAGTITDDSANNMALGGGGPSAGFPGHVAEMIFWKSQPSPGPIRANQAAYWIPSPLLVDLAPGAVAAYSLRKLSNGYTGPSIRVRRASDNATQDIGFLGQNLDVPSLQNFLGGAQGFVSTWYDQSGNGINATQGTAANQPQIIASRAALGGMPVLQWATDGGINGTVQVSTGAPGSITNIWDAGAFIAHVFNIVATATASDGVIGKGAAWDPRITSGTRKYAFTRGASTTTGSWQMATDMALGAHALAISYSSASLSNVPTITVDGVGQALGTSTQPVGSLTDDSAAGLGFGQRGLASFPGDLAEIVIWKTQTPGLATIQANQKAYWGTP